MNDTPPNPSGVSDDALRIIAHAVAEELLPALTRAVRESIQEAAEPRLLKPEEAADFLRISDRSLDTLITAGQIKPLYVGDLRRFTREALVHELTRPRNRPPRRRGRNRRP